jgi:hypothetical protein
VEFVKKFADLIGCLIGPREWLGALSLDVLKHLATVRSKTLTNRSRRPRKTHIVEKFQKVEDGPTLRLWRAVDHIA